MWLSHWKLRHDPFADAHSSWVPLPGHAEAVARLAHAIETGERSARLVAAPGLGKTRILEQVLAETRSPARRTARILCPSPGPAWLLDLANRLGAPIERPHPSRSRAWRRLADAFQVCAWQGLAVVLAIDNSHLLREVDDRRDLERLVHLAPSGEARLTVIEVGRPGTDGPTDSSHDWQCAIRLAPLMRSEVELYLNGKLAQAGREENPFAPAAVTRLHSLASGTPRGLDRLATLSLMASAVQGLDRITPEVVAETAREFLPGSASE